MTDMPEKTVIIEALQDKDDRTAGILQKSVPAFLCRHLTDKRALTIINVNDRSQTSKHKLKHIHVGGTKHG